MTRARLVIGNWKMNPETIADAVGVHGDAGPAERVGHRGQRDRGGSHADVRRAARQRGDRARQGHRVGETEAQFAAEETEAVLKRQIERDLDGVRGATPDRFVVAYEPVWAIGTGRPATGAHASAAARTIRTALRVHGLEANTIRILYGGSVAASTVAEFASADGIDGALVGGASLKADEFAAIVKAFGG